MRHLAVPAWRRLAVLGLAFVLSLGMGMAPAGADSPEGQPRPTGPCPSAVDSTGGPASEAGPEHSCKKKSKKKSKKKKKHQEPGSPTAARAGRLS